MAGAEQVEKVQWSSKVLLKLIHVMTLHEAEWASSAIQGPTLVLHMSPTMTEQVARRRQEEMGIIGPFTSVTLDHHQHRENLIMSIVTVV